MKKNVSVVCLLFVALSMMAASGHVKSVTAIGEVLGDGAKTTAIAIEYDAPIPGRYRSHGSEASVAYLL